MMPASAHDMAARRPDVACCLSVARKNPAVKQPIAIKAEKRSIFGIQCDQISPLSRSDAARIAAERLRAACKGGVIKRATAAFAVPGYGDARNVAEPLTVFQLA